MGLKEKKRSVLDFIASDLYVPMKEKEIAILLQVTSDQRELLKEALSELLLERKIQISKRGKYSICETVKMEGVFISNAKGFGFIEVENQEQDFFVPESEVKGAFHKDLVAFELLEGKTGKRQEARVISVLSHTITQIVGTFEKSQNFGFVIPDDSKIAHDIFIPKELTKRAVNGSKVVIELTNYGHKGKKPEGRVIEILGHINDPGVDIMSIIKGFEIPCEFPEKVMNQAINVAKDVSEADRSGRRDLRNVLMVTIDGEDAKDLDDAVSLELINGLYRLGVHIADVTNYVQENSALDREALARGTSVYLVDRVIPMLPHVLSNGMCSLNAKEDRLALSCIMDFNEEGNLINYEIAESVICVDERMTYTDVANLLEPKEVCAELKMRYQPFLEMFDYMKQLSFALRENRRKRGAIDFNTSESKIILNHLGKPIEIKQVQRNIATKIIEDFMLAANETIAQHFYWLEIPFLYRSHEVPNMDKIKQLDVFIRNFGYYLKCNGDSFHSKEFQKLLNEIEGTEEEVIINRLTLRSMKQARYTNECIGHFGLACQYYCHFTSPIRRYPDLQIHRIIKETLRGKMDPERIAHYQSVLNKVAKQCSDLERRAQEAERETDKCKKVEFMEDKVGNQYIGTISGLTSWGMYVELENTVEGFIPIAKIEGDYFEFKEDSYQLIGTHTNTTFHLGQTIKIKVNQVNKLLKTIDFVLVNE